MFWWQTSISSSTVWAAPNSLPLFDHLVPLLRRLCHNAKSMHWSFGRDLFCQNLIDCPMPSDWRLVFLKGRGGDDDLKVCLRVRGDIVHVGFVADFEMVQRRERCGELLSDGGRDGEVGCR